MGNRVDSRITKDYSKGIRNKLFLDCFFDLSHGLK